MIRIKVGDELYDFQGTIDTQTNIKYLFEKRNPFISDLYYRYGKYYQDTLNISLVVTSEQYENLYYDIAQKGEWVIGWDTLTGYQSRRIKSLLPYPSELRFLNGGVEFNVESEPFKTINKNMPNITINFAWNVSTISNTSIAQSMGE